MRLLKVSLWVAVAALCLAVASASTPCVCREDRTECYHRGKYSIQPQDICPGSTTLNFGFNRLTALPRGVDDRVVKMDLSSNRIATPTDELRALSRLRVLDISWNIFLEHLRFLPERCALTHLDASVNSISSLEGPLAGCTQLEELVLLGNHLRTLSADTFAALGRLTVLVLQQNPLRTLQSGGFSGLTSLRTLNLRFTELETLPDGAFTGLGELRKLNLDENHLRTVTRANFRGLSALEVLHLCENNITELPVNAFREIRNLSLLDLEYNQLSVLPDGLFAGLPLEELWVQSNRLEQLPVLSGCCPALRVAAFDDNRVSAPSEVALRELLRRRSLEDASLRGNPVRVDALVWAARAPDVELIAHNCHCGVLLAEFAPAQSQPQPQLQPQPQPQPLRQPQRQPVFGICVEVECPRPGHSAPWTDWVEAVRAMAQNSV